MGRLSELHRKANIAPENYEYFGSAYFGTSIETVEDYDVSGEWGYLVENLVKRFGLDNEPGEIGEFVLGIETDEWTGSDTARCVTCGSVLAHVVVFNHSTEGPVAVGRDCAKDFYASSEEEMRVRRAIEKAEIENRKAKVAEEWAKWLAIRPDIAEAFERFGDHDIIADIAEKGATYGDISPKAAALVRKIAKEETVRRAEALLAEEAEAAAGDEPVPVTDERIEFTGTVLKRYWKSNDYGEKLVMIFLDDRGFKVWGTVPSKLGDSEVGDRLKFAATVTVSDEDPGFGFFKRPTKAALLTRSVL